MTTEPTRGGESRTGPMVPPAAHHRGLNEAERGWVDWIVATCERFGASSSTAYKVASVVADDFERGFLDADLVGATQARLSGAQEATDGR